MAGVSAGVDLSKLHFHFPHLVGLCGSCGVMRKWSFCLWALIWAVSRPVDLRSNQVFPRTCRADLMVRTGRCVMDFYGFQTHEMVVGAG